MLYVVKRRKFFLGPGLFWAEKKFIIRICLSCLWQKILPPYLLQHGLGFLGLRGLQLGDLIEVLVFE
jgi:hypothetical protein